MKPAMMTRGAIVILMAAGVLLGGNWADGPAAWVPAGTAWAEEAWKAEFEDVCGKTSDAASFPVEELRKLVERCDKLKPQIEALEATPRKVYLRRLQMCRDLYAFVLESRLQEKPKI